MNRIVLIGCLAVFLGCSSDISKVDLPKLNGYWEIEQVAFPDGNTKEYRINGMVDYIQLDGLTGWRKKMRPKFDGTYQTSDDAEEFLILEEDGNFIMSYRNELSEWSERLVALDADAFSVVNKEGKRYDYKRFDPISIEK